jgi:hypothetical protein
MKTAAFKKSLTVSFRQEAFERIKMITDVRQTSLAEFIREAVDKALEKEPLPDELRF